MNDNQTQQAEQELLNGDAIMLSVICVVGAFVVGFAGQSLLKHLMGIL